MGDSSDRIDIKLDGSNYTIWKPSAMAALVYRDLFEHVEGLRPCPAELKDTDSFKPSPEAIAQRTDEIRAWIVADRKAWAILFGSIDHSLRPQFSQITGAKNLWDQLAEMFTQKGSIRIYQLRQELANATQGSRSIREFYNHMKHLWSQLDSMSPDLCSTCLGCASCKSLRLQTEDHLRLYDFLMKLRPNFEGVRGQLLYRSPTPSLFDAIKELQSEETRLGLLSSPATSDSTAVLATPPRAPSRSSSQCAYCLRSGHVEAICYRKKRDAQRNTSRTVSTSPAQPAIPIAPSMDKRLAALEAQLARLSQFQLGSLPSSSNTSVDIPHASSSAAATPSSGDTSSTWILDSGAARHMSTSDACLTELSELKHPARFFTADGSPFMAVRRGTLTVSPDFCVPDVLHVPSLALNLLSVGQLTDAGCTVSFTNNSCFVQDRSSGRMIGRGSRRDGLYTMQHLHLPSSSSSFPHPVLATVDLARWHQRLGHIPSSRLAVLHQRGALGPISSCASPPCSICPLAKQTALPFPISTSRSSAIFDLVHSDVWGPAPNLSKSGFKYYVSFIDDYSRYTWVYLMRQRSDFFSIYQTFTAMVSTQFHTKIKVFRSDSGGEYLSGVFRSLLARDGTIPQLSCPGVPAQNGIAERKHRHILETTRALLLSTSVPTEFWAEALLTAVHLINRLPSFVLLKDTPFQRLHSRPPTYAYLRVFGCTCFVLLPPNERTKLTARSVKCVFLGYSTEHKGYRCYDPVARRVRISRHVTFYEHLSYFSTTTVPKVFSSVPFMDFPVDPCPDPPTNASLRLTLDSLTPDMLSPLSPPDQIPVPPPAASPTPPPPPVIDDSAPIEPRRNPPRDRRPPARYVTASSYSAEFGSFLAAVHAVQEPTSYREAMQHAEWRQAMSEELLALQNTGTWELVSLPPGRSLISCRWIYKVKTCSDGSIERYKARLVARGFSQEYGIDYEETFAPVAKMTSVRTLLAVASARNWPIFQLDVKNAFLHGDLSEEIYMQPPPGLVHASGQVCRLRRALYGLKQAPRAWFEKFGAAARSVGFVQSEADHAMFIHKSSVGCTVLLLYVDNMIITGDDSAHIAHTKRHLHQHFAMKNLGPLTEQVGDDPEKDYDEALWVQNRRWPVEREAQERQWAEVQDSGPVEIKVITYLE